MSVFDKVRSLLREYMDALDEEGDIQAIIQQVKSYILKPIRVATSAAAIKAYLTALLFLSTSFVLIGVSSTAYFLFYYNFIPRINLEQTIYLQYAAGSHPHAIIPLQSHALIAQQQYDIEVVLHMPRTRTNLGAGNFMLDISLLSDKHLASTMPVTYVSPGSSSQSSTPPLHRSRRPAMLPYSSTLTGLSYSVLHLPSHLLRLRDLDSSTLVVPLFERLSFPRGRQNIPTYAYLELQSQITQSASESCPPQGITLSQGLNVATPSSLEPVRTLQVYSAKLKFRARFKGLRYIVYNFRIVSFLVFSTLFYFIAIASMGIAWLLIDSGNNGEKLPKKSPLSIKQDGDSSPTSGAKSPDSKRTIKSDGEPRQLYDIPTAQDGRTGSENLSDEGEPGAQTDTSTTFPGIGRTVPPLRYSGSARNTEDRSGAEASSLQPDDGINDAGDEDDDDQEPELIDVKEEEEEEEEDQGRFADSGMGTSMESEQPSPSLVRRRSGRSSRGGRS